MYKRILVPLDGSRRAEQILAHVEELALHFEAKVIFLQVIEPERVYPGPAQIQYNLDTMNRRQKEAEDYLAARRGVFREKGIKTQVRIEHGAVASTIHDVAQSEDVDLIAMASHGRGGLARVFYGSVASAVLQRVDRPLLLIRSRRE